MLLKFDSSLSILGSEITQNYLFSCLSQETKQSTSVYTLLQPVTTEIPVEIQSDKSLVGIGFCKISAGNLPLPQSQIPWQCPKNVVPKPKKLTGTTAQKNTQRNNIQSFAR